MATHATGAALSQQVAQTSFHGHAHTHTRTTTSAQVTQRAMLKEINPGPPLIPPPSFLGALLPELKLMIIAHLDLISDAPARDLLPPSKHRGKSLCCGYCESLISAETCRCHPSRWRERSACACRVFRHPVLVVDRTWRALSLGYIYERARFEMGPCRLSEGVELVRDVDAGRMARVRRLSFIVYLDGDAGLKSSRELWTALLDVLYRKCTHPAVRIWIIIVFTGEGEDEVWGTYNEEVERKRMFTRMIERWAWGNRTVQVYFETKMWLEHRETGEVLETGTMPWFTTEVGVE